MFISEGSHEAQEHHQRIIVISRLAKGIGKCDSSPLKFTVVLVSSISGDGAEETLESCYWLGKKTRLKSDECSDVLLLTVTFKFILHDFCLRDEVEISSTLTSTFAFVK